ncbi:MAG: PEP-CTERM sorting domain-containing protein [Bryobacterales bacterium]|nr:PEP-CTERM sorting domain-containing protein [Bryobacterales bacterium]
MSFSVRRFASVGALFAASAMAATIRLNFDPFAGSTALTDPGRQVVGNELFTSFNTATDVFSINPERFNITAPVMFLNDIAANIPASGVNVVVLETTDNDNNPATAFNAGTAANLIAAQVTTPGPGFFIYFNSGLNLPRLVYSTDLNDPTADLKVLARLTNLTGQTSALADFTAANFAFDVPEPASIVSISSGMALLGIWAYRRRRK